MKKIIRKILTEEIHQKTVNLIFDKIIKLMPIKNGHINVSNITKELTLGDGNINVNNLDEIRYVAKNYLFNYLKNVGLTTEEIAYLIDKFIYEYAFMEGNGPRPGDTIVLDYTDDPYTELKKGSKGTFKEYDGLGQLRIKWENGSSLSLIPETDKFHVIRKK